MTADAAAPAPVDLAVAETGANNAGTPVVILHGLFGQKKNWGGITKQLGRDRRVLAADLRNHGDSPWADEMSYPAMAADVAALIESRLGGGPAAVIGHSMGGKAAMILALTRPELVARLGVIDIAPAPTMSGGLTGFVEAMRAIDLSAHGKRGDVDAVLARHIPDENVRAFLLTNLETRDGALAWKPNLAALATWMPEIEDFPDTDGATPYDGPALFLAGGRSDYVGPQHQAEIERLFPNAEIDTIPEAGHWIHADAPQAFLARIGAFLDG